MTKRKEKSPGDFVPLRTTRYYIMASLFFAPNHGYAIIVDIRELTGINLRIPTVYHTLSRLKRDGLIKVVEIRRAEKVPKATIYQLTQLGKLVYIEDELAHQAVSARNTYNFWLRAREQVQKSLK